MCEKNFEVFLADTPKDKNYIYSIRYQVYCEEMGLKTRDDSHWNRNLMNR